MAENTGVRLKRMVMRAQRRGTREMDLILGEWASANLATSSMNELDIFDALLSENDQDLLAWFLKKSPVPPKFSNIVQKISDFYSEKSK